MFTLKESDLISARHYFTRRSVEKNWPKIWDQLDTESMQKVWDCLGI